MHEYLGVAVDTGPIYVQEARIKHDDKHACKARMEGCCTLRAKGGTCDGRERGNPECVTMV